MELLGGRWTAAIIRVLLLGPRRFSDLLDAVPRLSSRLLSQRLDELVHAGIVTRDAGSLAYGRIDKGEDLRDVLAALEAWTARWGPSVDASSH